MQSLRLTFWQSCGNYEYEVACDYYHNGQNFTGGNSGCFYTGKVRQKR